MRNKIPTKLSALFVVLFSTVVISAENIPNGLPLILMNSIASESHTESHPGDLIQLQEAGGQQCRFFGRLTHQTTSENPDTLFKRLVAASGGNSGNWSIMIARRTCSGVVSKVALTVPLKLTPMLDDYRSGSTVIALPVALGSQ